MTVTQAMKDGWADAFMPGELVEFSEEEITIRYEGREITAKKVADMAGGWKRLMGTSEDGEFTFSCYTKFGRVWEARVEK